MQWARWLSPVAVMCVVMAAASPCAAQRVLFLVANRDSLINFDPALKLRLEWQHGAEVTVEQGDAFDTQGLDELAREHDMVLISESIGSTTVLDTNNEFKLQSTPVPVMSFEAFMWDDAFWTEIPQFDKFGNTGRTDLIDSAEAAGLEAIQTDIYLTDAGAQHSLGAGFPAGALTIHTQPYSVNFGTPSAEATVIATADALGEWPTHYVYETGATLVDGSTVPAPRIAMFIGQAANPNANYAPLPEFFNDDAWALIDAAFEYALGPMPTPGDVNQDGEIDLADFNQMAGEFFTTGMTRADVNHDMVVDFADFGLWKVNSQAGTPAAVPEPASCWLLAWAPLALLAGRRGRGGSITARMQLAVMWVVVSSLFFSSPARAVDVTWLRTAADGPSVWNEDANWLTADGDNFTPAGQFDESAVIANGGTAYLDEPASTNQPLLSTVIGRDNQDGFLEIRQGGSLPTRALQVGGPDTSALILSGDAELTVTGDASTSGITRIIGPNVSFSVTGGLTTSGSFQPVITGATHSAVTVDGAATLSGTVRPEFDGVVPANGNTWGLIDAGSVSGNFTVDSSLAPSLAPGLVYASAVNSTSGNVDLVVRNTLDLVVDRRTGQTSIRNVVGDPISLDGYTVTSPSGRLNPADGGWLSLADSGSLGPEWSEGTTDAQTITESRSTGTSSIEVGSPVSIGAPVVPANFAAEDLEFNFTAAGVSLAGLITYEGLPFNLILNVAPDTGAASISNRATVPITFDGYAVSSPSGALRPEAGGWMSLEDSGAGGGNWVEANPSNNSLAELNPTATTTLAPNESLDLGTIFDIAGDQDLSFQFFLAGGSPDLRDGFVSYAAPPIGVPGDCNGDGLVDIQDANCTSAGELPAFLAANNYPLADADGDRQVQFSDFVILSNHFSQAGQYTDGDFDKDGTVQFGDFVILSNQWGQTGGAAAAVPEPSAWVLLGLGGLLLGRRKPRRAAERRG